ncbi:MAG: ABC transporter ATP-binding protein [Eubacteriales bacterium]
MSSGLYIGIREVRYPGTKTPVLRNMDISVPEKTFTAVIGRNGSGKSTLISCIGGLLSYDGTVTLDGQALEKMSVGARAGKIAVMQQSLRAPHITVEKLLSFGRQPYLGLSGMLGDADRRAVEEAIRLASLDTIRHRYLDGISGGELRRAYLGMALAQDTPLLLLDEATANMDVDYEASFLSLLRSLPRTHGKTVMAVMHNLTAAVRFADAVIVIDGGCVRFHGTPEDLCAGGLMEEIFHTVPVKAGTRTFFDTEEVPPDT